MLNVVAFYAVTPIHSVYDVTDDPVNSVTEFVIEVCFDIQDNLPGDERDAESGFFNLSKLMSTYEVTFICILRQNFLLALIPISAEINSAYPEHYGLVNYPPPETMG
jgi:hypothetical protein